jgi:hypothetical protein
MNKLDPHELFNRIAEDIPQEFHGELFLTGSLAAAYHFRAKLEGRAVNTKDADLVVHPFGNVDGCERMAIKLFDRGWIRTEECYPRLNPTPTDDLRAIRLYPPQRTPRTDSSDYFLEFLGLPEPDQTESKRWIPLKLNDGWYGLPCFRFFALLA